MSSSKTKKLWGGRFAGSAAGITERLSVSVHYDARMYHQDIRGSIAHASMLNRMGILSDDELKKIITGLQGIEEEIEGGIFSFSESLEDIHMNIEARLTEMIGDAGKKLHTGRSRNDQVALDMRLYLRDECTKISVLLKTLLQTLVDAAEKNIDVLIPGYTHLQVAQPVRFGHHLLAYAWKLQRDANRLQHVEEACSFLPLGSGALAGVNYENDREFLRRELGFSSIMLNSMDAVSDRDFILDFLYFASVLGTHLSRLSEELVLWSSSEFNFVRLADAVTTGSSIMPQKRNPDLAELIRGKTGRLNGNLVSLLTILKGLPMTYNRDLQEDKEPLFDSIDTIKLCLEGMEEMIRTMTVNNERMGKSVYSNFSTATDLADYLVMKGVPFRLSHEIVGNIVRYCEETGKGFFSLKVADIGHFSDAIGDDITDILNPELSTERKRSIGSTARKECLAQIRELRSILSS